MREEVKCAISWLYRELAIWGLFLTASLCVMDKMTSSCSPLTPPDDEVCLLSSHICWQLCKSCGFAHRSSSLHWGEEMEMSSLLFLYVSTEKKIINQLRSLGGYVCLRSNPQQLPLTSEGLLRRYESCEVSISIEGKMPSLSFGVGHLIVGRWTVFVFWILTVEFDRRKLNYHVWLKPSIYIALTVPVFYCFGEDERCCWFFLWNEVCLSEVMLRSQLLFFYHSKG